MTLPSKPKAVSWRSQANVAAVYQRHEFLSERRQALDLWGAHLGTILSEVGREHRIELKIVA